MVLCIKTLKDIDRLLIYTHILHTCIYIYHIHENMIEHINISRQMVWTCFISLLIQQVGTNASGNQDCEQAPRKVFRNPPKQIKKLVKTKGPNVSADVPQPWLADCCPSVYEKNTFARLWFYTIVYQYNCFGAL